MSMRALRFLLPACATALMYLSACAHQAPARIDYDMGERVVLGPLTYNVVETTWRSQLGDDLRPRMPERRFLLISISVTNGGGREVSVPMLRLENANGEAFPESENGEGVDNWMGILRSLGPAQTQQGRLVFDVPLASYKLRVTDGGAPGSEKYAWVAIPLRIDTDTGVQAPLPLPSSK